jgi:hypothetical protein
VIAVSSSRSHTVVVAGAVAQRDAAGGHVFVFLQYLGGLRRLGFEVFFIDRLEPGLDAAEAETRLRRLRALIGPAEPDGCVLLGLDGEPAGGLSRTEVLERVRRSAALINVMGYLDDEEVLAAAPFKIFLDIDPGFPQMWHELGLADVLTGYDAYVTIGEHIGEPACSIPTCGLDWITTRQPVVLEQWPIAANGGTAFTSVCTWRGAYDPVEYKGTRYGLRVHEFRKFAELPRCTKADFELALDIHPAETPDLELLANGGWRLVDPIAAAGDPQRYQEYIQRSRAEFMVAKGMYVQTQSGWFSDRSICYLASGRPVLAQDTGISQLYPTGEGLLTFTTLDEAIAGVEEVTRAYARHSRAARALAEEYFDSDVVLPRLLEQLGVA